MRVAMSPNTSSMKGTLYFAFGSNLSTTQMLQRCPQSAQPVAVATLSNYGWFICERGYANVIPMPPTDTSHDTEATTVWGLIYLLTSQDEAKLDRFEGWSEEACGGPNPNVDDRKRKPVLQGRCDYNKLYLLASVEKWLVDRDARSSIFGIDSETPDAVLGNRVIRTLIYVDENRTRPGRIKTEYISRLSRAVKESIPLGISETWVDRTMRQHGIVWWLGESAGKRDRGDHVWSNALVPESEWESIREQNLLSREK